MGRDSVKAELIDVMGNDLTVVNAARVSFDKESDWVYTDYKFGTATTLSEKDQRLINYLATHNHWTPFSHVQITMRETVPIFVARQRFKHMVGFTYNEVSRRYVDSKPEFFAPDMWRKAADNKKQGSTNEPVDVDFDWAYHDFLVKAENLYTSMIDHGVAPEQARMVLPQSMYTSYYVTGSLAAWARAYKLRSDDHAQKEIQDLAALWNEIIGNIYGLEYSWKGLTNGVVGP